MVKPKLTKKKLIKLIDKCIKNMATKGIYYPRRLKPKWESLTNDDQRLALFESYLSKRETSIGLSKLVIVNLCHKTLEAIILENPDVLNWLSKEEILQNCINKFSRYENGRAYLKHKGYEFKN